MKCVVIPKFEGILKVRKKFFTRGVWLYSQKISLGLT